MKTDRGEEHDEDEAHLACPEHDGECGEGGQGGVPPQVAPRGHQRVAGLELLLHGALRHPARLHYHVGLHKTHTSHFTSYLNFKPMRLHKQTIIQSIETQ